MVQSRLNHQIQYPSLNVIDVGQKPPHQAMDVATFPALSRDHIWHTPSTLLDINLDAIAHNYRVLSRMCSTAVVYPVLKANAYGLGAIPIGIMLANMGCPGFFVAYIDEALALRAHVPHVDIYVLNGPYDGDWQSICVQHRLIPVFNTMDAIDAWHCYAQRLGINLKAALHVDTGMRRLGLPLSDVPRVIDLGTAHITWSLVMSHLACADDPNHPFNEQQRCIFDTVRTAFKWAKCSLANSPGAFLKDTYHYDMVRCGGALYGHNPLYGMDADRSPSMTIQPCVTLKSRVVQIQELQTGDTVGYGCSFVAAHCMRIATIALGYADGLFRHLSRDGNAYVMIRGCKAPLVGRVSMDLITVDVTHIDAVELHDWATIIGSDGAMTIDDMARVLQTDSRDILTRFGMRIQRQYTVSDSA